LIDRSVSEAAAAAVSASTDQAAEVRSAAAGPEVAAVDGATEEDAATVETGRRRSAGASIDVVVSLSADDGPPMEILAADESAMALMLSEPVALAASAVARAVEAECENQATPALDELVERIPTGVRELLDELFRARFVRVSRVPAALLKPR